MTSIAPTTTPPIPVGMDPEASDQGGWWQDDAGRNARFLWTAAPAQPAFLARFALSGVCSQADTGEVLTDGEHTPSVFFEEHSMSIEDAEAVGAAFLSVAAQLRELCGIAGHPDAAVRAAKAAVQLAHIACRTLPGNAGDYLRAAMDSVTDAEAVLR